MTDFDTEFLNLCHSLTNLADSLGPVLASLSDFVNSIELN